MIITSVDFERLHSLPYNPNKPCNSRVDHMVIPDYKSFLRSQP